MGRIFELDWEEQDNNVEGVAAVIQAGITTGLIYDVTWLDEH